MPEHTVCRKTQSFSEAAVPCEIYHWQNLTFYWLWLKESGLRWWFQFHCPHMQSCMRCKYWISLWCRWCIILPQCVSTTAFDVATGLSFTGNVELVMSRLLKLSLLLFVYCFTDALSTAGRKCFFISSAETQCVSDELSLLLRGFTSFRCCVCRC